MTWAAGGPQEGELTRGGSGAQQGLEASGETHGLSVFSPREVASRLIRLREDREPGGWHGVGSVLETQRPVCG